MLLAVVVLAASACTEAGSGEFGATPTATPTAAAMELPCSEAIATDVELPDSYAVIAEAVALPTSDSAARALQTSHREDIPPPNYFAKTGLVVRPGVAFTITVEAPSETAQLGWGCPANFDSAMTTAGCAGEGWQAFAGGFLVDELRCIEVTVTTNDNEEAVQIGVGAPCEGQQPPPEPTDP